MKLIKKICKKILLLIENNINKLFIDKNIIDEYLDIIKLSNLFLLNGRGFKLNRDKIKLRNQINKKMFSGEYKLNFYQCLCGNDNDKLIAIRDRYGIKINTVICKCCGLIRTNPYYDEEALDKFYNIEYRPLYTFVNNDTEEFFKLQVKTGNIILQNIKNNTRFKLKDKIVYEVGTGMGGILKAFQNEGAEIKGVDLGKEYIELGIQKGLDLELGSVDILKKYPKADLLILNHIVEHIINPISFLKNIRELISDAGYLYIAVPTLETIAINYDNNIFNYLQNAHVFNFSQKTLRYIAECSGYKVIVVLEKEGAIICKKSDNYRKITDIDKNEYNYAINLLNTCDKTFFRKNKNV